MIWVPVALAAAVFGGLAYLRMENTKVKPNDYIAVNSNSVGVPIALPTAPPNAQVLIRVDQVAPDGSVTGQVVGYVEAQTNTPQLLFGGAGGVQAPPIRREWIAGHFRGAPPSRVA